MNDSHQKNVPTVLVILGATGDLMKKKIVPALYDLFEQRKLPRLFQIIGFARRQLSDTSFREQVAAILADHHDIQPQPADLKQFLDMFFYHQGDFTRLGDFHALARELGHREGSWRVCANKLFYLAVPPEHYARIFRSIDRAGLNTPCGPGEGWLRIIVEKPFGNDLRTAKHLDTLLGHIFPEEEIYRIDHYLAKEMLQNILTFRFSNNLLEENWNNRSIERIDIRLWENLGIEDRGVFYDGVGALRDVGQNHLLQMLAMVTMDHPKNYSAAAIRGKRAELLATLRPPTPTEVRETSVRGQYSGYQTITGVQPQSPTETYFKVEVGLDHPRWRGVPILLESGKRMGQVRKEIVVTFKHPSPCLCPSGAHVQNRVVFEFEPKAAMRIDFWAKKPGLTFDVTQQSFDVELYRRQSNKQYVEEYSKLLLDCIIGDQTLFVSTAEIQAMWRTIDPILAVWKKNQVPLRTYRPDTDEATLLQTEELKKERTEGQPLAARTIGMVGLGKMGGNLARQLLEKGWRVVGWNRTPEVTAALAESGLEAAESIKQLVTSLPSPRVIWLMLPAGKPTDELLFGSQRAGTSSDGGSPQATLLRGEGGAGGLISFLSRGDIVIDGGNAYYEDSIRRSRLLKRRGIRFVDVGVSGGPGGARTGACLMVGGDVKDFEALLPLFLDLAVPGGVEHFAGAGAGHFVKMIHNGIEYGMMQAMAEGFAILRNAPWRLDLARVAEIYNHGSVIESRLVGWLAEAFRIHGWDLTGVTGTVAHTGEGQWTVETAKKMKLEAKIIKGALEFRKRSATKPSYTGQILSALRKQFGGHSIK